MMHSKRTEQCPHCRAPVDPARAVFLQATIIPFGANLGHVAKGNSQGWFHWHPRCAEKSIARRLNKAGAR